MAHHGRTVLCALSRRSPSYHHCGLRLVALRPCTLDVRTFCRKSDEVTAVPATASAALPAGASASAVPASHAAVASTSLPNIAADIPLATSGAAEIDVASAAALGGHTRWPLWLGGMLSVGVIGLGGALHQDSTIHYLQPRPDDLPLDDGPDDGSMVWRILSFVSAYSLATVPVDELKIALIQAGALEYWVHLLHHGVVMHEALAFIALIEVLDGSAAISVFHSERKYYVYLINGLQPLLKFRDVWGASLELPDKKKEGDVEVSSVLNLGATIASHPYFVLARGDERVWDALIQAGMRKGMKDETRLPWSAIVAAAARRPQLAQSMMLQKRILLRLLQIAEPEFVSMKVRNAKGASQPPANVEPPAEDSQTLQKDFARSALHRLAKVAATEGLPRVHIGWGRYLHDYIKYEEPALPLRPPAPVDADDSEWKALVACAAGGMVWGAVRVLRRSKYAGIPIGQSALTTSLGAGAFEGAMQLKLAAQMRLRSSGGVGTEETSHTYETITGATLITAGDLCFSFWMLYMMLQPGRVPFAFGGWCLGQCGHFYYTSDGQLK